MIKAIVLDCFGVLVIPTEAFMRRKAQQRGETSEMQAQITDLARQADYGFITQTQYEDGVAALTGLPIDQVRRQAKQDYVRNQELIDYAQELRKTYKVGVLSNISSNTMDKFFTQQERQAFFDVVVCSSDVGMVKPNPEIYEYTAQQLGARPFEAVMIDDTQAHCEGAVLAGMTAIRYTDFESFRLQLQAVLSS
jgi:HAD superfamily hydrolase (TIGR01509 family)